MKARIGESRLKNHQEQISNTKVLLIDDREPISFAEILAENCPIPIDIQRLKVADYVVEDVFIERKEINDFAASLRDKRMWTQLEKLTKVPHAFILISGSKATLNSRINPHSILGAMAYLASKGVTIIKVDDASDLAYLILKIFEKFGKFKMQNGSFKFEAR